MSILSYLNASAAPIALTGTLFNPTLLFDGETDGGTWEVSADTVWADTAGTIPATVNAANGVARIDDLSGNGYHLTQATSGSRPVLRGTPTGNNLVDDPYFDDGSGWSAGSGWAIQKPVAIATTSSGPLNFTGFVPTAGKIYLVAIKIARTAGSVTVKLGGASAAIPGSSGTFYAWLTTINPSILSITGSGFTGRVDYVSVLDASAGAVGAPYFLQFTGAESLTATISLASYPLTLIQKAATQATGGSPCMFGVQLTNTDYKAIVVRGSVLGRKESTIGAAMPIGGSPTFRIEMQEAEFTASAQVARGDGDSGPPVANTNSSSINTTLSLGKVANLTAEGLWWGGTMLPRVVTAKERAQFLAYHKGDLAIRVWGGSMTTGLGALYGGWVPWLGSRLRRTAIQNGYSGQTSDFIKDQFLARTNTARDNWINIFWFGSNDRMDLNGTGPTIANFAACIADLPKGARYLVAAPLRADDPVDSGTITLAQMQEVEASLLAAYGNRFVDIRGYLAARGNGSATDNADIAVGATPTSLRAAGDNKQLNDLGYRYVADCVEAKLAELGWTDVL